MKLLWIACLCAFLTLQMSIIMNSYQLDAQLQSLKALQEQSGKVNLTCPAYNVVLPTYPPNTNPNSPPQAPANYATEKEMRDKFFDAMKGQGSDKVTTHKYDLLYGKYLAKLKNTGRQIRMLEIGFGCDFVAPNTPGGSARAWRQILGSQVDIYMIEFDGNCVKNFESKIKELGITPFVGSQSDRAFLRDVIAKSGGKFDFIVEDGGHTMLQQRVSTEELFPHVVSGGYFFLEDLQTAYINPGHYNADNNLLMTEVIKSYIDWLMGDRLDTAKITPGDGGSAEYVKDIISFECMHEMCVFTKK